MFLGTAAGNLAGAQETGTSAANAPSLAEIIVTAQKRSENIQDVPIAVITPSAQQLQDSGVTDIKNMTVLTPGLTVTSTTSEGSTTARIRGIGTVGDNPGLESSVGIVIDGVYRPRNGVSFGNLGEIQRIEILEGPQGELFGKNNDAGVINITTQ
jgi:iron complex outermembrane recepter protein